MLQFYHISYYKGKILIVPCALKQPSMRRACKIRLVHLDIQLPQLLAASTSPGASAGHHVPWRVVVLGKAISVANNVLQLAEEHHHAIDAQGDAAVRWGAELQSVQKESKAFPGGLLIDAQEREDLFLDFLVVDTNRAAARLVTTRDYQIVGHGASGTCQGRSRAGPCPADAER